MQQPSDSNASSNVSAARVARHLRLATCGLLVVLLAGCGAEWTAAEGEVTLDGQPMEMGVIKFVPGLGVDGPLASTKIVAGHYRLDAADGLRPGEHRIEIYLDQPPPAGIDDADEFVRLGGPQGKVPLPINPVHPKFNTQTTLKAIVKKGSVNRFDFSVTTTGGR